MTYTLDALSIEEKYLLALFWQTGNREDVIAALENVQNCITVNDLDILIAAKSLQLKLESMSDTEFDSLNIFPDSIQTQQRSD